jgi:hypothetical protein
MASYPDIDKIDTNIRHAKGIIELIMTTSATSWIPTQTPLSSLFGPPSNT